MFIKSVATQNRTETAQAAENNEPKRRKPLPTDTETARAADNVNRNGASR